MTDWYCKYWDERDRRKQYQSIIYKLLHLFDPRKLEPKDLPSEIKDLRDQAAMFRCNLPRDNDIVMVLCAILSCAPEELEDRVTELRDP